MAGYFELSVSGYSKNENGETLPGLSTLRRLSDDHDISLDWLILNKGPKYFKEKEPPKQEGLDQEKQQQKEADEKIARWEAVMPDVKDLLEYMEQDPLLRHEVLAFFYKYKKKSKEVEKAPKTRASRSKEQS
jgi:transcriptional regulator with XRE-family HTH domain